MARWDVSVDVERSDESAGLEEQTMYVRQLGYTIVPGQEERAVALCNNFAGALRERGVDAHVLVGSRSATTLQVIEEYASIEAMHSTRRALECDENYRSAVSAWASEFYPLVQSAAPALVLHNQQAA